MTRKILFMITFLIGLSITPSLARKTAVLKSNWGPVTLSRISPKMVTGTYADHKKGFIELEYQSDVNWKGYWAKSESAKRCSRSKVGRGGAKTYYWGQLEVKATQGGQGFLGYWSYCEASPSKQNSWEASP